MRKLIALVVATAAMSVAGLASAATVDLFLTQAAPGSTSWALTMNVNAPITVAAISVQITSGGTGSFVIGQSAVIIDPAIPTGFSLVINDPGNTRLGLAPGTQAFMTSGVVTGFLIGTFTGTGPIALLQCNVLDCPTVSDGDYAEVDASVTTVPNIPVPEPAALILLGIGLGGISLARRKAA